jgi:hypothetical protein
MKRLTEHFLYFWIGVLFSVLATAMHLHGSLAFPLMITIWVITLLLLPIAYLVRNK